MSASAAEGWLEGAEGRAELAIWLIVHATTIRSLFLDRARDTFLQTGSMSPAMERAVRAAKHRAETVRARAAWLPVSISSRKPKVGAALRGMVVAVMCAAGPVATAHADGLSEQQIALAARIVQIESGGNQHDARGGVLTSSAGARGLMQLMPATARGLGVNPDTAEGNIRGGLTYITQLWDRYRGDPSMVAAAYNCGPHCADDWRAGKRELPDETKRYVAAVADGWRAELRRSAPSVAVRVVAERPPQECGEWHSSRDCVGGPEAEGWADEDKPDPHVSPDPQQKDRSP